MTRELIQHYQTCKDVNCPLFKPEEPEKGCKALKAGNCKYQNISIRLEYHMLF